MGQSRSVSSPTPRSSINGPSDFPLIHHDRDVTIRMIEACCDRLMLPEFPAESNSHSSAGPRSALRMSSRPHVDAPSAHPISDDSTGQATRTKPGDHVEEGASHGGRCTVSDSNDAD